MILYLLYLEEMSNSTHMLYDLLKNSITYKMIENIYDKAVTQALQNRFNQIHSNTSPLWGQMNAGQMLAHCCVTYELIFENKHPKPGLLKRWLFRLIVKPIVTGEKTYPKNTRTGSEFIITNTRNFDKEKARLFDYMNRVCEMGSNEFEGKVSQNFGRLTAIEWNNMMYKHLDHHLKQFGV